MTYTFLLVTLVNSNRGKALDGKYNKSERYFSRKCKNAKNEPFFLDEHIFYLHHNEYYIYKMQIQNRHIDIFFLYKTVL